MFQLTPGMAKKLFYEPAHPFLRIFQIFVKGDALVIVPCMLVLVLIGFLYSWAMCLFVFSVFYAIRQLGEMIFWLFQQFHDHTYRPYDFRLTLLNTHSIYILYQVSACVQATIGVVCAVLIYSHYL